MMINVAIDGPAGAGKSTIAKAAAKGEPPFVLLLDELQDPQNVGA